MFLKDNKYKDVIIAVLITFTFCIIIYKAFDILGPGITYFFKEFVSLSMPFVYGIVIAYILSPVVRIFERRLKLSNGISIALTYAVFLGIIFVLCIYGIPSLIDSIKDIASNADSYMESVRSFIDKMTNNPMLKDFASTTGVVANLETYISKVGTIAVNLLESSLSGIFSVSSQIVKVILGFIVSIYVLIDKNRLIAASKKFLELFIKKEKTEKIIEFMKIYNDMIGAYIGIKALDSLIIGIMAFILLSIVNSEYAVLLSIIVGCTNMIPYFGPLVGEIVGAFLNATDKDGLYTGVGQLFDWGFENFITKKIVSLGETLDSYVINNDVTIPLTSDRDIYYTFLSTDNLSPSITVNYAKKDYSTQTINKGDILFENASLLVNGSTYTNVNLVSAGSRIYTTSVKVEETVNSISSKKFFKPSLIAIVIILIILFFNIRRSTVSGVIKTMEKNNIIIRENVKDDNKSKEIKLTNEVYLRANDLVRKLRELDLELLKDINKEDLEVFMRVLKNIQDNLKEERK